MSTNILRTKLFVPRVRGNLISRPRLLRMLSLRPEHKLTLVTAPAGFGKTTLLSDWINQQTFSFGWLSLEEADNDAARFITYLLAAMQSILPNLALEPSGIAHPISLPSGEAVLTSLLNQVAENTESQRKSGQQIVLILDDYHLIEEATIHQLLNFLLDHMPHTLHLVIASRADPPLNLVKLRARGQLNEIRVSDLRFTQAEATRFLSQALDHHLSEQQVSALETRTEGWIAGLQLAAVALRGRQNLDQFIRAFTGSQRYILDYLADEVLLQQPEEIQDFLMATSILDRMNADLCNAVTQTQTGEKTIRALERANLFLVSLDDEQNWYRYHRLFADLLRYRLKFLAPSRVTELHQRASAWFSAHGLIYEALGHALAAQDYDRAARIIEDSDASLVMRGETRTLMNWLDALPEQYLTQRPRLSLAYAWAAFVNTDLEEVERRVNTALQAMQSAPSQDERPCLHPRREDSQLGEIAALLAFIAAYRGEAQKGIDLAQQALEKIPEDNYYPRVSIYSAMGDAYLAKGLVQDAMQVYRKADEICVKMNSLPASMVMKNDLVRVYLHMGKLRSAHTLLQEILSWGEDRYKPFYALGQAHVALGALLLEWNQLAQAEYHLEEGIRHCELGGYNRYLIFGNLSLARLSAVQKKRERTQENLGTASDIAEKTGLSRFLIEVNAYRARLALLLEDAHTAGNWLEQNAWDQNLPLEQKLLIDFTNIRVKLCLNRMNQAELQQTIDQLEKLAASAAADGRNAHLLEIHILSALCWQAQGDENRALISLGKALDLAEPEGFTRLLIDEGEPAARLLRRAAARGMHLDFVRRLLENASLAAEPAENPMSNGDELTERELEVLRLLAIGLSNAEIAAELVISISTVKTHISRVYGKLEARNRAEAIHKARKSNLI